MAATGTSNSIALYMLGVSVLSLLGVLALKSSPTRFSQDSDGVGAGLVGTAPVVESGS
jgi:LPXTG-motif cell wall-anchored protein